MQDGSGATDAHGTPHLLSAKTGIFLVKVEPLPSDALHVTCAKPWYFEVEASFRAWRTTEARWLTNLDLRPDPTGQKPGGIHPKSSRRLKLSFFLGDFCMIKRIIEYAGIYSTVTRLSDVTI